MNNTKHTPGPWEHKGHRVYRKDSYAVAWIEQQGPHSEWQANGKLIAAAPAMYEALLGCLKVAKAHLYDVLVRHEDHDGKVPKGIAEVDAARMEVERLETVLTQAEGR